MKIKISNFDLTSMFNIWYTDNLYLGGFTSQRFPVLICHSNNILYTVMTPISVRSTDEIKAIKLIYIWVLICRLL